MNKPRFHRGHSVERLEMRLGFTLTKATSALLTWALKGMFHRPAANFPGKIGLYFDPQLIAHLRPRLHKGSIVVVGTNGKTTVTNLLANSFEAAGESVACNRTGANLDSGVATALLQTAPVDWGIFESDELWLARILPQLKPDFVVLLNLFRDQLDRMGEIDHIQEAISSALASSPTTTLVYNCDDPLCQVIADRIGNDRVAFGIDQDLHLEQNAVADASMCQRCDSLLAYEWRQYGQLGAYRCPRCGFSRESPHCAARNVAMTPKGTVFTLNNDKGTVSMSIPFTGTYMLYNALSVCAAADCCGISFSHVIKAIHSFEPRNGRLQRYEIDGYRVLLNLAKNPTGLNQNLRIIMAEPGPKAVAVFINDREADGHDVSWLWDADFQELAGANYLTVFSGGIRRNDMQVRLKYAGIKAELVDDAGDFLSKAKALPLNTRLFLIANYTALPQVKAELDLLQRQQVETSGEGGGSPAHSIHGPSCAEPSPSDDKGETVCGNAGESFPSCPGKLSIVHLYPELLNLYGDGGNVIVLADRARRRGIQVNVTRVSHGQRIDLSDADIVFLGGGPDREQHLASLDLLAHARQLREYVEDDGVMLAICGGYQILGRKWLMGNESVPGLGIIDIETKRAEGGSRNRLVGNIALESTLANAPVIGYENHAGRTFLGAQCKPFGFVTGKHGYGNNDVDKADGVLYRNVLGTYLHGPLLSKNPEVADHLIEAALARRAAKEGRMPPALPPLDDSAEHAANEFMSSRLGLQHWSE